MIARLLSFLGMSAGGPALWLAGGLALAALAGTATSAVLYYRLDSAEKSIELQAEQTRKALRAGESQRLRADLMETFAEASFAAAEKNKRRADAADRASRSLRDELRALYTDRAGESRSVAQLQAVVTKLYADAARCAEIATGAALTEDEESGKIKNAACPGWFR